MVISGTGETIDIQPVVEFQPEYTGGNIFEDGKAGSLKDKTK